MSVAKKNTPRPKGPAGLKIEGLSKKLSKAHARLQELERELGILHSLAELSASQAETRADLCKSREVAAEREMDDVHDFLDQFLGIIPRNRDSLPRTAGSSRLSWPLLVRLAAFLGLPRPLVAMDHTKDASVYSAGGRRC